MSARHVVLITYGEPPTPSFTSQLRYSWRILLGLTRAVASIPAWVLPMIAVSRARTRHRLWSSERYGSPLEAITRAQAELMRESLAAAAPRERWEVHVAYEFRDPSLPRLLDRIPADERVDVVPLYVADSAFTHEISRATLRRHGARARRAPVRVAPALDADTCAAVATGHIEREIAARGVGGPEWALVLAAHGTLLEPPRPMETGRVATERVYAGIAARLRDRFGMIQNAWLNHVYGGRWTEPAVDVALRRVVEAGYRRVVYLPYGFMADNAESELEGRIALRAQPALEAVHLPCPNVDPELMRALARRVLEGEAGDRAPANQRASPVAEAFVGRML